ncbi:helix-turn-helix domain-containing protein [Xinfangfangia sp. CPCC 101601]|uniref:Helix-turn-helix domain-containing protein n=1 Tax=Pseudogemmobacter lacusdianii TaxID=3069608 RepID=A0ABU0W1D8_9RHOB|nr:helix-turn-helix domain-containing protein [Xinfangfangia sp. CPCC 101601]MDQ2067784.1 helix-turn-helix domain-containing protein [Xinfangfangia sp. CPCC 101601]
MTIPLSFPVATPPDLSGVEPDMKVGFLLAPRFTLIALSSFVDSLRHAGDEADFSRQIYCAWQILSETPGQSVASSSGIEVVPSTALSQAGDITHLVVVGGLLPDCYHFDPPTLQFIRDAYARGVSIVGLCTGSFLLAELGLLEGRRCAVHNEHISAFRTLYPKALATADDLYVSDRGVFTCQGGTSALELAFHLIDIHCGKARATKAINSLLMQGKFNHSHRFRPHGHMAACGNRKVEQAVEIMERHLISPMPITDVARSVGCSTRELSRLFQKYGGQTPSETWRRMRVAHGHWMLLNTERSITQIAYECGFADSAHFTRCFKDIYKTPPNAYRIMRRVTPNTTISG